MIKTKYMGNLSYDNKKTTKDNLNKTYNAKYDKKVCEIKS